MALGHTVRATTGQATPSTAITTGSFTPTADSILIAISQAADDTGAGPPTQSISDSTGLTWNTVVSVTRTDWGPSGPPGNWDANFRVWWAQVGSSPSSMTVTASSSPQDDQVFLTVIEVTGADVSPIGGTASSVHLSDTGTMTLSSGPASDSYVFSFVSTFDAEFVSTYDVSPADTEIVDYTAPISSLFTLEGQLRTGGSSSVGWTDVMVGSTVSTWDLSIAVAFEIKALSTTREQATFRFYDDGTESGSTALAAQDTDITRTTSAVFQLRIGTQYVGNPPSESVELQYKENGDAASEWRTVP